MFDDLDFESWVWLSGILWFATGCLVRYHMWSSLRQELRETHTELVALREFNRLKQEDIASGIIPAPSQRNSETISNEGVAKLSGPR